MLFAIFLYEIGIGNGGYAPYRVVDVDDEKFPFIVVHKEVKHDHAVGASADGKRYFFVVETEIQFHKNIIYQKRKKTKRF
ncbi:unknown [Acidaminococcus sp. CAG:917]|nr:unknown [Acidaminococcus sp. CAG:917]